MKNTDWKILTVLYDTCSMTKAADVLYMTQSALTKRVRAMETEWGVEIVKRSSQGVCFTENGTYLVKKARIITDFMREIEEHFADSKSTKTLLRVGVPNSFSRIHLPQLLKHYQMTADDLEFRFVPNNSDTIIQQLTSRTIDIGIVCGEYPFIGEKVCLLAEQMYMVTPKGMKFEEIEEQPLIESCFNSVVKLMVNQWWQSHFGVLPQSTHKVPYADIAIEMVEQGLGVTFVFGAGWKVDETRLQKLPVYDSNGEVVSRNVWMMINDGCMQKESIMDFISFVEKYYHVNC